MWPPILTAIDRYMEEHSPCTCRQVLQNATFIDGKMVKNSRFAPNPNKIASYLLSDKRYHKSRMAGSVTVWTLVRKTEGEQHEC